MSFHGGEGEAAVPRPARREGQTATAYHGWDVIALTSAETLA